MLDTAKPNIFAPFLKIHTPILNFESVQKNLTSFLDN
jgi:hypothetical protein